MDANKRESEWRIGVHWRELAVKKTLAATMMDCLSVTAVYFGLKYWWGD